MYVSTSQDPCQISNKQRVAVKKMALVNRTHVERYFDVDTGIIHSHYVQALHDILNSEEYREQVRIHNQLKQQKRQETYVQNKLKHAHEEYQRHLAFLQQDMIDELLRTKCDI